MINPDSAAGGPDEGALNEGLGEHVALFTVGPKIIPVANHLLLDYQKPTMAGSLHVPVNMKQVPSVVSTVVAAGPEVKDKNITGKRVLVLAAAFVGGAGGLEVNGHAVYITTEAMVIAVVE